MASSKEYLDYVLEQLSELDDITSRGMGGNAYLLLSPEGYGKNICNGY